MDRNLKKRIVFILILFPILCTFFYNIDINTLILTYTIIFLCIILIYRITLISFIGNFNYTNGNFEKAIKFYKVAIEKDTNVSTAYLNYAIYLMEKENNPEYAIELLKKSRSKNNKIMVDKNILLTMGTCYWLLGDIDRALEILTELEEKYDYLNVNALTTLGYMYFLNEDYEKALEYSNRAIEEDDRAYSAWDNLGQIYYKTKNKNKAIDSFKKALAYKDDLVDSNYYLGVIYDEENNIEMAKKYFEKAYISSISPLNSVSREKVKEMYKKYF